MSLPSKRHIPFNRPFSARSDLVEAANMIARKKTGSPQSYLTGCESFIREAADVAAAYLLPSCTQALEMATLLAGIGPGDEVIMPSFTFASTANVVALRGATPVFIDIRPDTCNLDASLIGDAITARTRAIIPVHYAGVACEMEPIMALAAQAGLTIIEDAAHAVFASWNGRALGSIGHFGAYSFHYTKNITSGGQGGALLINAGQSLEAANLVRENGTNRGAFLRGEVAHYEWVRPGGNFTMSEAQAILLWHKLQQGSDITESRVAAWNYYYRGLESTCARAGIALPHVPPGCQHNGHIFYVLLPSAQARKEVIDELKAVGIEAVSHYEPLHCSPAGREVGRFNGPDVHTTKVASTILRLPVHPHMSRDDQDYVMEHFTRVVQRCC